MHTAFRSLSQVFPMALMLMALSLVGFQPDSIPIHNPVTSHITETADAVDLTNTADTALTTVPVVFIDNNMAPIGYLPSASFASIHESDKVTHSTGILPIPKCYPCEGDENPPPPPPPGVPGCYPACLAPSSSAERLPGLTQRYLIE